MAVSAEQLPDLDPDDPRHISLQLASALRDAIRSDVFAPGDRLPGQTDFASRYGVARETVKAAIRRLAAEGLVVSRQGSGVFVRSTPTVPPPGATELEALKRDLEALRAHLRKTTADVRLVEGRVDDLLNAWEAHEDQSTADAMHPQ